VRPRQTKKSTAYHEAGHVVIGRVLTLASGGASIKADYDEEAAGSAETADPWVCFYEWEKRGKVHDCAEAELLRSAAHGLSWAL
jgi:hypothetical protein